MSSQPMDALRRRWAASPLEDDELRDEIELLFDVIVTASEHRAHLTAREIDAALHLVSSLNSKEGTRHGG